MLWTILVFIISFLFGFGVCYYNVKTELKQVKNLEEMKIKYNVRDENG